MKELAAAGTRGGRYDGVRQRAVLAAAASLLPVVARAGPESVTIDNWFFAVASAIVTIFGLAAGILVAFWRSVVMRRDYIADVRARDARCKSCADAVAELRESTVTREKLEDTLKPILNDQEELRKEAAHRKRSMETLGKTVTRMDRNITAILVHMKIDVREFGGALGNGHPDEGDDTDR